MFAFLKKSVLRGFHVVRANPGLLYTLFLLVAIPIAFLASGQNFLDAARKNQERIEQERVGLMYDVFTRYAGEKLVAGDNTSIQEMIESLAAENPSIEKFKVVRYENNNFKVVASLDQSEVGSFDEENTGRYRSATLGSFFAFQEYVGNVRHWRVVKPILNMTGEPIGVAFSDISMAHIDQLAAQSIKNAYLFTGILIFVIFLLLLRHARIIDYAVLYRRLEEVDKMKDDFVSIAAHELRTPLVVIRGYLDLLSKEHMSDEDKESMERINISVEQLNTLINDILDVARVQQGRMQFDIKRVEAVGIVHDVAESFMPVSKAKNIDLQINASGELFVSLDGKRLKQILVNLIGNAIKYTPEGKSVDVSVKNEEGRMSIRVSDTGIGISADDQKRLFGKFFRVRNRETEDIRGTGLGLWITAQIIAKMGGRISVESIKGKGTDFIVSFPLVNEQEE